MFPSLSGPPGNYTETWLTHVLIAGEAVHVLGGLLCGSWATPEVGFIKAAR